MLVLVGLPLLALGALCWYLNRRIIREIPVEPGDIVPRAFFHTPAMCRDPAACNLGCAVEINERLLQAPRGGLHRITPEVGRRLIPHPTIGCRWNLEPGEEPINDCHARHGNRPAVWRADMWLPECWECMIEDPYE
jgi:hypothetical protein